jgi:hypothetical protein
VNGNLESVYQNGDEGGEVYLNKPVTNTSITTGVTVDVYQNKLRFFETGGTNRGAFIDITKAKASIASDLLLMPTNVGCRVRLTSTASVANNSLTATITFSSSNSVEDYDTDNLFHNPASNANRLTVPYAGKYLVTGFIEFSANATGLRWAIINHESSGTAYGTVAWQSTNNIGSVFGTAVNVAAIVNCAANDYFRLFAYQNSGGSLNAAIGTQFAISYLGD